MFYVMAETLNRTGMADKIFETVYYWLASLKGGLGMSVVVACAIFGAMSGIGSAAIVTMSILALPSMLKRKYHTDIAVGSIAAGAPLGFLIPPSVLMIFYAIFTGVSVGKLFIAGILPGILLATLYCIYIGIRCWRNPSLGPSIPLEERPNMREKLASTRGIILPGILILLVLGTIYLGICTVTEAAGIGAAGSIVAALIYRKLTLRKLWDSLWSATKLNAMVMWLCWGGIIFGTLLTSTGMPHALQTAVLGMDLQPWMVLIGLQVVFIILGMFVDPFITVMICIPTFYQLIVGFGFNELWFALLFIVNSQIGWLTPPFGFSLYLLEATVPKHITLSHIIHSVWPFIGLQIVGLLLIIFFPQIATWLPGLMMK